MECSFCIWLARSNKDWTPSTANCNLKKSSLSSLKQIIKPVSNTKSTHPVGFINKGNTCYANSILQVLSVVPNLWNRVPSEHFIAYVTGYQSQHGCKKEFNQTC